MRLILDTNVLVAASRAAKAGPAPACSGAGRGCRFLVSASLLIEYEAVLKHEGHRAASGASIADVDEVLDALTRSAEPVETSYLRHPHLADPGDELVLETAVNGGADMIATFDLRHLASAASRLGIAVARLRDNCAPATGAALVRKSKYALRLQPSLMDELRKVAAEDQTTINQLINVAVAEKLALLRSRRGFEERAARGDPKRALQILSRLGRGHPPLLGDELVGPDE
jgi:predicted nucleic acid-binding protein